ncbi:hypothetical protein V9T40_002880 [Parthenolecanium corni]|uniref:Uncharacterized protein n=1 Tax=Parthenolecanium corni TaxID=536013 RepID=A0AAN9TV93_9HEMI
MLLLSCSSIIEDGQKVLSLLKLVFVIFIILLKSAARIPDFVWMNLIPFPSFLFEDTFSKSTKNDTIVAQLSPPEGATVTMVKSKEKVDECNWMDVSEIRADGKTSPRLDGETTVHSERMKSSQHLNGESTPQSDKDNFTRQKYNNGQSSQSEPTKTDSLKNLMLMW